MSESEFLVFSSRNMSRSEFQYFGDSTPLVAADLFGIV